MEVSITCDDPEVIRAIEEYLRATLTEECFEKKKGKPDKLMFLILFRSDEKEILTDVLERYPGVNISARATYSYDECGYQSWTTERYTTVIDDNGKKVLKRSTTGGWA